MVEFIRQILFVPKCKRCFKLADSNNLCSNCARELAKCRIPNPHLPLEKKLDFISGTYASYKYEDAARDVIISAKFRNPAAFIASLLDDISIDIKQILAQNNIDIIVPVPSHKSKLYTQEFDLPDEMAKKLAKHIGAEYSYAVKKTRKTEKQHNLARNKRKTNLVNAFEVTENVAGKRILLIDDVITTGITVSTIAADLKLAGRDNVYVWAYTFNKEKGNT
jgi:ComF family protein